MSLKDPVLSASKQLMDAARSSPSLRRGSGGPGVALLQSALMDLGYRMPVTTRRTGKPDGKYGSETRDVVAKFQRDNGVRPDDGIAGRNTLRKLDQRLVARNRPRKIHPVARPVSKKPAQYRPGLRDPRVPMDPVRPHGRVESTLRGKFIHSALWFGVVSDGGAVGRAYGRDAAKSMRHYLLNSGSPQEVRFRALVAENKGVLEAFKQEIDHVKEYVEKLPLGSHTFTSIKVRTLHATDTDNWALTVGGLNAWGKGKAIIIEQNGGRVYDVHFVYQFKDRYNFDKGKGFTVIENLPISAKNVGLPLSDGDVRIVGDSLDVRDTLLKRLHDEGYARNFVTWGRVNKRLRWMEGKELNPHAYNPRTN